MHAHEKLITEFYTAFGRRDADAMAACYHREVRFSDPVFRELSGDEARAMWRMLVGRGKDLEVEFSSVSADDSSGRAHWDARYTFSKSGRKVLNRIDATFRFQDGKIIEHRDAFDLWAWSRMALGPLGWALGWSPMVQGQIRNQAGEQLRRFMDRSHNDA